MYGVFVGGACALVIALMLALGPAFAAGIVAAGFAAVALVARPVWSIYAAIIVGLTAFPSFIPYSIQLGSTTLFLFEPFLFIAAIWAIYTHPAPSVARSRAWLLAGLLGCASVAGVFSQHPLIEIVGDGRGLLTVLLAFVVVSRLFGTPYAATGIKVLLLSLWVSLAVIMLSMVFKFKLAGRTEAAALFLNSSGAGTSESTRFLTAASEISVLVLCASIALVLAGRSTVRQAAPFLVPSLLMTFLSFSRNSFLAVGLAVVFAIILARTVKPLAVTVKVAAFAAIPILIFTLANASFGVPGGAFVTAQIDAFMSRVVGGLDTSTLSDDTSAIARMNEDAYLMKAIGESPVVGHGFGFAYRPPVGSPGTFAATKGQYYGHNFYLWLMTKTGILGLGAFFFIAITPVLVCLRRRSNEALALASASAGLLLSIAFAPFPNDVSNGGSLAVGILLGALVAATTKIEPKHDLVVDSLVEPRSLSAPKTSI